MNRWLKLALLFGAALVAAQLFLGPPPPRLATGTEAPRLALADLEGRRVDLAAFRGRPVLVNFWATWCAPCRAELPELAQLWRDRCVEVLGVVEDSPRGEIIKVAREIPYPVLEDPGGVAAAAWGVQAFPTSYLVDGEGSVLRAFAGPVSRRSVLEALPGGASTCGG